jgi:NitT/TauT family transport system permease protein/putative hydroxymethylpyrimidine transport system permease protein
VIARVLPPLLVVAALLTAWQVYVSTGGVDDLVLASPSQIAESLWDDRSLLLDNLAVTAQEVGLGIGVSIVLGVLLAFLIHRVELARRSLYPLMVGSQAVPLVIFAPVLVYWVGFGIAPKLAIIALICFVPVVVTTYDGLRNVDPDLIKLMRTLGSSGRQTLRFAELPAALPAALSGARIAVAIAVIGAVLAEQAGSTSGLGHLLLQAIPALETARAFAAAFVLAGFAIALFYALSLVERRLLPSQPR